MGLSVELGMGIEPKSVGEVANSASPKQFLSLFEMPFKLTSLRVPAGSLS